MENQLKRPPTMSSKDSREDLRVFQKGVRTVHFVSVRIQKQDDHSVWLLEQRPRIHPARMSWILFWDRMVHW